MKYKFFLIIGLLFLLSGCSLNYRLDINKNGLVEEKCTFVESKEKLEEYTLDNEEYISSIYENISNDKKYNTYSLSTIEDDNNQYGVGIKKYIDFENFKNKSIIVGEMFKNISVTGNNGIVKILMEPKEEFKYFEDTSLESSLLEEVNIEIKVPYKVTSSNEDSVTDNVYVWNIKKGNNLKTINITYDTNQIAYAPIPTNTIILASAGLFVLLVVLYVYIKYKRNGL